MTPYEANKKAQIVGNNLIAVSKLAVELAVKLSVKILLKLAVNRA